MTIQSNEFVRTNIKETKQTTHEFDLKPFFLWFRSLVSQPHHHSVAVALTLPMTMAIQIFFRLVLRNYINLIKRFLNYYFSISQPKLRYDLSDDVEQLKEVVRLMGLTQVIIAIVFLYIFIVFFILKYFALQIMYVHLLCTARLCCAQCCWLCHRRSWL